MIAELKKWVANNKEGLALGTILGATLAYYAYAADWVLNQLGLSKGIIITLTIILVLLTVTLSVSIARLIKKEPREKP